MLSDGGTAERREGETNPLLAEHIRALSAEVAGLKEAGGESLTDTLAHWLAAHYVVAARAAEREAGGSEIELQTLRGLSADVVALRRGDHYAERLRIERERLELDRAQANDRMEALFMEWAQRPENKSRICDRGLSEDEKAKRIREIFGRSGSPDSEEPRRGLSPETLREIEKAAKLL
jgi:hypothetical protein